MFQNFAKIHVPVWNLKLYAMNDNICMWIKRDSVALGNKNAWVFKRATCTQDEMVFSSIKHDMTEKCLPKKWCRSNNNAIHVSTYCTIVPCNCLLSWTIHWTMTYYNLSMYLSIAPTADEIYDYKSFLPVLKTTIILPSTQCLCMYMYIYTV